MPRAQTGQATASSDDEACLPPPLLPAAAARWENAAQQQALVSVARRPAQAATAARYWASGTQAAGAGSSSSSSGDEPPPALMPAAIGVAEHGDTQRVRSTIRHHALLLNLAIAVDAAAGSGGARPASAAASRGISNTTASNNDGGGATTANPSDRPPGSWRWSAMGPSGLPATDAIRRAWHIIHRESATPATLAAVARQQQQQPPGHWHAEQQQQPDQQQSRHTEQEHRQEQEQRQEPAKQQPLGLLAVGPLQQLQPEACLPPAACSFLRPGTVFRGSQRLMPLGLRRREQQWDVSVTLQDVDLSRGYVAGSMTADVAGGPGGRVETFWEGCVIDDAQHTFFTRDWGACSASDLRHWSKFEAFEAIRPLVERHGGRCGQLASHPLIYMRWKERFFVGGACEADSGLTIAGFYYVALQRQTGALKGFYFDQNSSPFQELSLSVQRQPQLQQQESSESSGGASAKGSAAGSQGVCCGLLEQAGAAGGGAAAAAGLGGGMSFASYSFA